MPRYRKAPNQTENQAVEEYIRNGGNDSHELYAKGVSPAGIAHAEAYRKILENQKKLGSTPSLDVPDTPSVSSEMNISGSLLATGLMFVGAVLYAGYILVAAAVEYTVDRYNALANYLDVKYEEVSDYIDISLDSLRRSIIPGAAKEPKISKFVLLTTNAKDCQYKKLDLPSVNRKPKEKIANELRAHPDSDVVEDFTKLNNKFNPELTWYQKLNPFTSTQQKQDAGWARPISEGHYRGYVLLYSASVQKPDGTILKSTDNPDGSVTLSGKWRQYTDLPQNKNPRTAFDMDINPNACDHGTFSYTVMGEKLVSETEKQVPVPARAPSVALPVSTDPQSRLDFLTLDGIKSTCEHSEIPLGHTDKSINFQDIYNTLAVKSNAPVSKELSLGMAMNGASADQKYDFRFNGGDKHPDGYLKLTGTWRNLDADKVLADNPAACTNGAFVLKAALK